MPDGKPLPAIVFNGKVIPNATALQEMFEKEMPPTRYDVQSYDCQVLNPQYGLNFDSSQDGSDGNYMSILIIVNGNVRMGPLKDSETRGFCETFVLVPKSLDQNLKPGSKSVTGWVIQSQNFRLVV